MRADQNQAVLSRLALNLLRQETSAKMGTKAKRLKAGGDHAYLLKVLTTSMRLPWPGCGPIAMTTPTALPT
jgi:hypothetical protein